MNKVQRPRPRKGEVQGEVEAYTVEEVRRILDGLENEPLKWRVFLRLPDDYYKLRGFVLITGVFADVLVYFMENIGFFHNVYRVLYHE